MGGIIFIPHQDRQSACHAPVPYGHFCPNLPPICPRSEETGQPRRMKGRRRADQQSNSSQGRAPEPAAAALTRGSASTSHRGQQASARERQLREDGSSHDGGIQPPLPLALALATQWAQHDALALLLAGSLQLALLALQWDNLGRQGVQLMGSLLALQLLAVLAWAAWPRQYARQVRAPLLAALRIGWLMMVPSAVDLLAILQQPQASTSLTSVDGAQPGAASTGASMLGAAGQLALPVALLPCCLGAALFWQLPPLAHAVVQLACVGQLMRRAPTGW